MSTMKYVRPLCFGASGSVRAQRMPQSAMWPSDVQTFWPFTIQWSSCLMARVARLARSEPAPGSENSWHQPSSPVKIGRRWRALCAAVPQAASVGATSGIPTPARHGNSEMPAACSARSTMPCSARSAPRPPSPGGLCTQASPRSNWRPLNAASGPVVGSKVLNSSPSLSANVALTPALHRRGCAQSRPTRRRRCARARPSRARPVVVRRFHAVGGSAPRSARARSARPDGRGR